MSTAASAAASAAARVWQRLPLPAGAATAEPLTVVTYNVLADKYATGGMHTYCPPQYLRWGYRKQLLTQELLALNADILCLQELERPFFEAELEPLMACAGYEALYHSRQRRPFDPPNVPEEGIALMFRKDRLERQASKAIRLGDCLAPGLHGKFWQSVRQRDDWALLALLRDRATNRHLVSACTHLFWDPKYPDVKAAQAQLLCRAVQLFLRQQPMLQDLTLRRIVDVMPLVICGDFNSLPFKRRSDAFDTVPPGGELVSGVYQIMSTDAGIDAAHHDHPARRGPRSGEKGREAAALQVLRLSREPLALESAAVAAWGREPPVTNRVATFAGTLDYVWLSRGQWAVSEALSPPYRFDVPAHGQAAAVRDPEDVSDLPPIPNQHFPSDHLALGFRLHLLPSVR